MACTGGSASHMGMSHTHKTKPCNICQTVNPMKCEFHASRDKRVTISVLCLARSSYGQTLPVSRNAWCDYDSLFFLSFNFIIFRRFALNPSILSSIAESIRCNRKWDYQSQFEEPVLRLAISFCRDSLALPLSLTHTQQTHSHWLHVHCRRRRLRQSTQNCSAIHTHFEYSCHNYKLINVTRHNRRPFHAFIFCCTERVREAE